MILAAIVAALFAMLQTINEATKTNLWLIVVALIIIIVLLTGLLRRK